MSTQHRGHRGRRLMTLVATVFAAAAVVLVVAGLRAQVHAAIPPASAANPAAEGNLPAPSTTTTTTPKNTARSGQGTSRPGKSAPASHPGKSAGAKPSTPSVVGPTLPRSKPDWLSIPKIGINHSHLAAYGTDSDGVIDIPRATGGVPAGWYTGSPTPGQVGPSVIVGHTDAAKDGRSIFFRLGELRPGNTIQVTRADHTRATFTIDSLESYPKDKFPTQKVYGNINHAGLRLISCTGTFDPAVGHYEDNLVVYAHLTSTHHP